MNEKKAMQAARRRSLTFTVVRGAAAIGIAILVAAILIFVSSEGDRFGATLAALRQLLIGPLFRANGSINFKNICDVLAAMIPSIGNTIQPVHQEHRPHEPSHHGAGQGSLRDDGRLYVGYDPR